MKNDLFLSWPGIFIAVALVFSVFAWWQSSSLEQLYVERTERELESRGRLFAGEAARLVRAGDPGRGCRNSFRPRAGRHARGFP